MIDRTASSWLVRIVTPCGRRDVADVDHAAEFDVGDVDLDLVGHVLREALDLQFTQVVLDDAAFLDPGGLADLDDRHVDGDRLGAADRQEVDVDEPRMDVVALDLTRDREVLGVVDHQVDQDVGTGTRVEQAVQLASVHGERRRLDPLAVEDCGHTAGRAELAGDPFAGVFTSLGGQLRFHSERDPYVRGGRRWRERTPRVYGNRRNPAGECRPR